MYCINQSTAGSVLFTACRRIQMMFEVSAYLMIDAKLTSLQASLSVTYYSDWLFKSPIL